MANNLQHIRFSEWKSNLQIELHADPHCNPDLANRFSRTTIGSAAGKRVARAIQTNGPAVVFKSLALVAVASLPAAEGQALLASVNALLGDAAAAADAAAADPIKQVA